MEAKHGIAFAAVLGLAVWASSAEAQSPDPGVLGPTDETAEAAAADETADSPTTAEPTDGATDDDGDDGGKVDIKWKDGKTRIKMDGAEIEISHRVQFGFHLQDPDDGVRLPGTDQAGQAKGSFTIRRAKTTFEGWFWKPEISYELQLTWAGAEEGNSNSANIEDLYLNWDAARNGTFQIKFGQYKVPFGRQLNTTSIGLEFVDRSILAGEFTRGRDIGLMVWGRVADDKLEYRAGMFNGNNASRNSNDNSKFQYDARVTFEPWGQVGYSEGDFESKDRPLVAFGVQFENNNLFGATSGLGGQGPTDLNTTIFSGDVAFKYKGVFLFGEYFARSREPETGDTFDSNGYNVQAGVFLKRDVLEVAARYASWDPTDAVSGNDQTELGFAVNYYIRKHRLKLQGDFRQLQDKSRDLKSHEVRIMTYAQF